VTARPPSATPLRPLAAHRARHRVPPVWPTVAAVALIVGALAAMLLVPLRLEHQATPVRARIGAVIDPARGELTALHLALAQGESLLRDELEERQGALLPAYRVEVARAEASIQQLTRRVARAGAPGAVRGLDSVRAATSRWTQSGAALLASSAPTVTRARDAAHGEAYSAALVAAALLDGTVAQEAGRLRTRLDDMEGKARRWTVALGALALAGVAAACWLAFAAHRAARVAAARGEELEEAAETRARFTRGLSHDLKNPLGAIDGFAELLLGGEVYGPTTEAQREALGRIRAAVRTLLALVDDLLTLARAESGEIGVVPCPTDLGALVGEVADEHRAAALAAGLGFEVHVPGALPDVATDPARVRQVLGNLFSNAIKYTPRGGAVVVSAALESDDRGAPSLRVRVVDTGPGIPADQREHVFAEFTRLPGTTAPGAGLGLAISRRVARLLGGDLWVDAGPSDGACFVFELPVVGRAALARPSGPGRDGRAPGPRLG
jgi:signal transduction histidine kinase